MAGFRAEYFTLDDHQIDIIDANVRKQMNRFIACIIRICPELTSAGGVVWWDILDRVRKCAYDYEVKQMMNKLKPEVIENHENINCT